MDDEWRKDPFWRWICPGLLGLSASLIASDLSCVGAVGIYLLALLIILAIYYR